MKKSAVLCAVALVAACSTPRPPVVALAPLPAPPASALLRPIGAPSASSTIVLATSGEQRLAFIADEDAKAVLTIDLATKKELARTPVGGAPAQLMVASDGRLLVTVRDTNRLVGLQLRAVSAPLVQVFDVATPAEPLVMATTPDRSKVLVTAGWGRRLAAFDAKTFAPAFVVKLPREPRGLAISDDGATAFVSHAVGSLLTKVDLATPAHTTAAIAMRNPKPIDKRSLIGNDTCQSYVLAKSTSVPNRIFGPQVLVDAGDPERRTSGYGTSSLPESATVAVLDEAAGTLLSPSLSATPPLARIMGGSKGPSECLLPRAAAIDPLTKSLLVTCFGADTVVSYDANALAPGLARKREWNVGAGPSGIAIDAERRQAYVFGQFDRTLSVLLLGREDEPLESHAALIEKVSLGASPLPAQLVVGRMLFHASGDVRISADGRACASCHPDGRDDAITWATPDGPRRSIMLAGRVKASPPYGWQGNATSIESHLGATFQRLRGRGLRSSELDALVAYVTSLPAPPPRTVDDPKRVARGEQIFNSKEAGCSGCHGGDTLTDAQTHNVLSARPADLVHEFDTPSLRFVGSAGPWFHDGRFPTLGVLLRETDGKMGHTKHLAAADIDALETYLETL